MPVSFGQFILLQVNGQDLSNNPELLVQMKEQLLEANKTSTELIYQNLLFFTGITLWQPVGLIITVGFVFSAV